MVLGKHTAGRRNDAQYYQAGSPGQQYSANRVKMPEVYCMIGTITVGSKI
jgi:hypothetical protein